MPGAGFFPLRKLTLAAIAGLGLAPGRAGAQQYDLRVFGVEDGLPGSTVDNITQDAEGFLWVETTNGIARFDGRRFTRYASIQDASPAGQAALKQSHEHARRPFDGPELFGSVVDSVPLHNGDLLLAHRGGLMLCGSDSAGEVRGYISTRNGLGDDDVRCVYQDASGVVWVGTRHGGITRYVSDAITWYDQRHGLPAAVVTAIGPRDDGRLLVRTTRGCVTLFRSGRVIPFKVCDLESTMEVTLPNGHRWSASDRGVVDRSPEGPMEVSRDTMGATSLAISGDSVLIGTRHGLYRAPMDNSAAHWTPVISAGAEDITCLAHDRAGNTWIGTADHGVVRHDRDGTQRWTMADGLVSDHIRSLLLDAYQNLWVGTDNGFNLMELDELQEEVIDIERYDAEDGFPGIEAMPNACMLDVDSALWFGTTRGAIRFDPRRILDDPIAPRTRITDLSIFFAHPDLRSWCDTIDANGLPVGLRLPYDQNHVTLTFSGLSLAYPEKVRFQYMLEGSDADWSPITAEDRVTYSGLEPGDYSFLVKARNGSGVWNDEPARFSFSITPPFWKTTGFRVAGGVALLLAFFGLQRARDRRSRKARERLERMVSERTRELADEKHRSETLLLNILPETTAAELKENGTAQARHYDACTVLFSDFQGFTVLSELLEATGIVTELDRFFRAFDRITDKYGTEKIKTIGDAYMCASGVPDPSPTHALDAVLMALEMLTVVEAINALRRSEGHPAWPIRIGLHSGPLIAGVVGEKKFAYDVWGDTVNLASRMESSGAPGRINVTGATLRLVERFVVAEARGRVSIKGKGEVESWFIDGLRADFAADASGRVPNEHLLNERAVLRGSRSVDQHV